ncbi:uncharacterized protein Z519_07360 [Cladophialophora bantiana CBS 173.52]|uniref:Uncharacterized protein n=1 Tax=Cladophialophora bantiana (strain ATCC 10958 / CBS 173.52 / CDC B-1940 / NIH 8579) TaxID=1442370 RepID=A0A0D2ER62_CLAB1|nr:uncharacterized protein Z519_07360 [Cladophialophora bantiana CBS 173.52]KIW92376.1 hypothetical protein Z519_07360 [Cladophialophora bantiana CBS 173.52]
MSSLYSGDHGEGGRTRASTKSIGHAMQRTWEWMATYQTRSSGLTASTSSHSPFSSKTGDLDLDSLFKRLDKYTAEMKEVEERLKRARSVSEKSEGINIKRFSFEDGYSLEEKEALPTFKSPTESSSSNEPTQAQMASDAASNTTSSEQMVPTPITEAKLQTTSSTKNPPPEQDQLRQDSPVPVFGNWKQWAEEQFLPTTLVKDRSSSRYSDRVESYSESSRQRFLWKRQSPSPPSRGSHHASSSEKSHVLDQVLEDRGKDHQDHQYGCSEDDEPGPSFPTSRILPPRTSSKKEAAKEMIQEEAITPPRPTPRRRMTTSDGRPSIRNGGFWSDQAAELFVQGDVPPVPALSQSNSNATLKSNSPLTPLTLSDPREDQLRREMESFAIRDGPETLEHRYKKRKPPMLNFFDSDDEKEDQQSVSTTLETDSVSLPEASDDRGARPRTRRRKSIFSIFQPRSPVEKLIDMYFDDEPEERPALQRGSIRSRKGSPVQEKMPKSPVMPPLPQTLHGGQTSL